MLLIEMEVSSMFFSIDLKKCCGLPLVAHATWDENPDPHKHNTVLRIFPVMVQVRGVLDGVTEGRIQLEKLISLLPTISSEKLVMVNGDAGASLAASIAFLANNGAHVITPGDEPELSGFFSPPWSDSSGIIIWRGFKLQHYTAIVWTKEQALSILDEFKWMDKASLKRRREKILKWALADKSENPTQLITGTVAHLFYMASLFKKLQSAISRQMN